MKYVFNKVYVPNKQVFKYAVMTFFSSKISILSLLLTGYGYMHSVHLALLNHSMPDYVSRILTIITWRVVCCMMLNSQVPGSDIVFV